MKKVSTAALRNVLVSIKLKTHFVLEQKLYIENKYFFRQKIILLSKFIFEIYNCTILRLMEMQLRTQSESCWVMPYRNTTNISFAKQNKQKKQTSASLLKVYKLLSLNFKKVILKDLFHYSVHLANKKIILVIITDLNCFLYVFCKNVASAVCLKTDNKVVCCI